MNLTKYFFIISILLCPIKLIFSMEPAEKKQKLTNSEPCSLKYITAVNLAKKSKFDILQTSTPSEVKDYVLKVKEFVNLPKDRRLNKAITIGDIDIVVDLLKSEAFSNDIMDNALEHAIYEQNIEIARLLIKSGARVHIGKDCAKNCKHSFDRTLQKLTEWGDADFIELLFTNAHGDIQARKDYALVLAAAFNSNIKPIVLLLKLGANINACGCAGTTPLIYAAGNGFTEIVKLLLKSGANVNLRNMWDETALIRAQKRVPGNKELIELLIKAESNNN